MAAKGIAFLLMAMAMALMGLCFADPRPNIVFVMVDDLGWGDLGYHGSDIPTPNIDDLAQNGIKLDAMYGLPLCSPARAAFMTGRYPLRYGLQSFVISPGQKYGLPLDERTLAAALREQGYKTHMVGKWHLGHAKREYWPIERGFDHFKGNVMGEVDYWTKERGGKVDWQVDGKFLSESGYLTHLVTDRAVETIAQHDTSSPMFLYIAHLAVHSPYEAPEDALSNFSHVQDEARKGYSAMVGTVDQSMGRVVRALEAKGIRDNTLIVFSSDNGGVAKFSATLSKMRGFKPSPADNGPYRGAKSDLYEGGVRVASFANWPGRIPGGRRTEEMAHLVDWFPTFLKLAGAENPQALQPEGKELDGMDIWELLSREDAKSPRQGVLLNVEMHRGAIRIGDMKLVKQAMLPSKLELFNIKEDPSETKNLAKEMPEVVEKLEDLINGYAMDSEMSLFMKEYMPFIARDFKKAGDLEYDYDETTEVEPHLPGASSLQELQTSCE